MPKHPRTLKSVKDPTKKPTKATNRVAAGVIGFFDPVRATLQPRAGAQAGLAADFVPQRVSVGLSGSFYTAATSTPREGSVTADGTRNQVMESVLSVRAPITYRISPLFYLEAGGLVTARAPHVLAEEFELQQIETWAYVAFTALFSTDKQPFAWGAVQ